MQVSAGRFLKVYLGVEDAGVLSISAPAGPLEPGSLHSGSERQWRRAASSHLDNDRQGAGLKSNKQNAHTEYEVGEGKLLMDIKAKSDWSFNLPMGL